MADIAELREKQQNLVAEARSALNQLDENTSESRAKELEQQHDAAMGQFDKLDERIQRMEKLAGAEERSSQPDPRRPVEADTTGTVERGDDPIDRTDVFKRAMCFGVNTLTTEERHELANLRANLNAEQRAQSAGTNSEGGFTVPEGFQQEIVAAMQAYGPMLNPGVTRQLVTATGNALPFPTMDDTSNKGALLAENTQATEQDVAFGQKQIEAYTYTSKIVRMSLQLLQDSAFDMNGLIRDVFGERIGRIANEHLTVGTGTNQPEGILTASGAGPTAAAAAAIDLDDVIDLEHSVDPSYRALPTTAFMFHDNILQALRKLKDGNGNYIWQPADVRGGVGATILGYPYVVNQDMTSTVGTGDKTMLFGAMEKYLVRRVRDFELLRLTERYADFLQVGFIGFSRMDGKLLDNKAVKHLVH